MDYLQLNQLSKKLKRKKGTINEGIYIGIIEGSFKNRYTQHKASFLHEKNASNTRLSAYVWELKNKGIEPKIEWDIITRAPAYDPAVKKCFLCLKEKETILYESGLINARNEIINTCRHRRKYLLVTQ